MDADQVSGIRVSVVVPRPRLDDRSVVYALHTRVHDLRVGNDTGRFQHGELDRGARLRRHNFFQDKSTAFRFVSVSEIQAFSQNRRRRCELAHQDGTAGS